MSQHNHLNSQPPRSRAPLIVGAVVAVVLLIAATVGITSAIGGPDTPTPPSTSASLSPQETTEKPSAEETTDHPNAKGCLGGVNPSGAVLAAQDEAELLPSGAAAFAATVMRWRTQVPVDPRYDEKAKKVMTFDAGSDLLTVDPPEGTAEDSRRATTDGARYLVTESTHDSATVLVSMPFFVTSKEYPDGAEVSTAARWHLKVVDGKWRVADMDPLEKSESRTLLERSGFTFEGVC